MNYIERVFLLIDVIHTAHTHAACFYYKINHCVSSTKKKVEIAQIKSKNTFFSRELVKLLTAGSYNSHDAFHFKD